MYKVSNYFRILYPYLDSFFIIIPINFNKIIVFWHILKPNYINFSPKVKIINKIVKFLNNGEQPKPYYFLSLTLYQCLIKYITPKIKSTSSKTFITFAPSHFSKYMVRLIKNKPLPFATTDLSSESPILGRCKGRAFLIPNTL